MRLRFQIVRSTKSFWLKIPITIEIPYARPRLSLIYTWHWYHQPLQRWNILKHKYENLFFNPINSDTGVTKTGGNKLRTYAKLKHEYKMENYLNFDLELHSKKAMAEIRVSAHNLKIERGWKNKPKSVPANERFCRNCKTMVEDKFILLATALSTNHSEMNTCLVGTQIPMHTLSTSLNFRYSEIRKPCHLYQTRYGTEKKNYIKTNNSLLSSLVVIHTHRRQPHHALICVFIYIYIMYTMYFTSYIIVFCVYQNDVLHCME